MRNAAVEQASFDVVKATNFSGFGAVWWWRDAHEKPFLIDFNARFERHTCLNSFLKTASDLRSDPCYALQTGLILDEDYMESAPHIVQGGLEYMDPVRAMSGPSHVVHNLLRENKRGILWNVHKADRKLTELIQRKVDERLK